MKATTVTTATMGGNLTASPEANNSYLVPILKIKKNLYFNRKWGCCNKHKFLSLVFMITKATRRREWKYHGA